MSHPGSQSCSRAKKYTSVGGVARRTQTASHKAGWLHCLRVPVSRGALSMASQKLPEAVPYPPEKFVVEVFAELPEQTVRERWNHLNVILRLSMLTGLQMQLDATLNLLGDMAAEIT